MATSQTRNGVDPRASHPSGREANPSGIFGLRYLEEEAVEIHDVSGCYYSYNLNVTGTGCDDSD